MKRQQQYHSYLLRLWSELPGRTRGDDWRGSLENPHTGEIINFTSLKRLFEFLEDQCSSQTPSKHATIETEPENK